jgi:hypothetical protein
MVATLASYTFVLQQAVPKTSYSTLLDYYLLSSLLTLSMVVLQNVALGWISAERMYAAEHSDNGYDEQAAWFVLHDHVQSRCRLIFWLTWLTWNALVCFFLRREHNKAVRYVGQEFPEAVKRAQQPDGYPGSLEYHEDNSLTRLRECSTPHQPHERCCDSLYGFARARLRTKSDLPLWRKSSTGELLDGEEQQQQQRETRPFGRKSLGGELL